VALGGGHGLASSLTALRQVTDRLTAVVTVADDGGSSGRLRRELGVLPPGDLRMALAALCGDDAWDLTWREVVQHRFQGEGDLHGHSVGNLLIVALWEIVGTDPVAGLDWVGRLLGARGRVLPMSTVPLDIVARVQDAEGSGSVTEVVGQVAAATAGSRVLDVALVPEGAPACPQAVEAVRSADWVVLGPGSWFTSVIPHLLVPELADAVTGTAASRCLVVNLDPQSGETAGFAPETHLDELVRHAPKLRLDVVIADSGTVRHPDRLRDAAERLGASLYLTPLRAEDGSPRHDPALLAGAFDRVMSGAGQG
jgi:uncharacterized cofD-like protein